MTRRRQIPATLSGAWGWVYVALREASPQVREVIVDALFEEPAPTPGQADARVRATEEYGQGLAVGLIRR